MTKKLAILDIGSNSLHLIVAALSPLGEIEIVERERVVLRLTEGTVGDKNKISPSKIEQAISLIEKFKNIAGAHGTSLRATATSAVRESSNKNEFLDAVEERTGIKIKVIDGIEEARLINLGIQKAVPLFDHESLLIDIGGGSTEFLVVKEGKILYSNSLKLGAVRLSQKFFPDYILTDEKIDKARKWIENLIAPVLSNIKGRNIEAVVGSSGTILSIGMMIKGLQDEVVEGYLGINNCEFSFDELQQIERLVLSKRTPDERKIIAGLEERRADIIPAGVIILSTIFTLFGIKKMRISEYGLKEGIIFNSIENIGND